VKKNTSDHCAHATNNAVNVYVNIYDVAVVTLCCPLGLMNVDKQTVVMVGQLKVIFIETPEKILQSVKSSGKVGKYKQWKSKQTKVGGLT